MKKNKKKQIKTNVRNNLALAEVVGRARARIPTSPSCLLPQSRTDDYRLLFPTQADSSQDDTFLFSNDRPTAMAALCGPSNALQNLQKHASADRPFHQDRPRVTGPSAPQVHTDFLSLETTTIDVQKQQGFRSATPVALSGWMNTEFDAFLAGGAPPPSTSVGLAGPEFHAAQSWANDFQQLEISQAPHSPQQQQQQQQQQPHWGLEFATRLQQRQGIAQVTQQQQQRQQSYATGYSGYSSPFPPQLDMGREAALLPTATTTSTTAGATEFRFDESAFEKAFEEAAREAQLETETVFAKTARVQPESQDKESLVKDSDDLARTAGQLLDSVRLDTSAKFQKSNFLALMRKLRDHEVVVEGDKMVEVRS